MTVRASPLVMTRDRRSKAPPAPRSDLALHLQPLPFPFGTDVWLFERRGTLVKRLNRSEPDTFHLRSEEMQAVTEQLQQLARGRTAWLYTEFADLLAPAKIRQEALGRLVAAEWRPERGVLLTIDWEPHMYELVDDDELRYLGLALRLGGRNVITGVAAVSVANSWSALDWWSD